MEKNILHLLILKLKLKMVKLIVDMENNLRSFSIKNGERLWSVPTELTVVSSQKKQSIIIVDNVVTANSIGDIRC